MNFKNKKIHALFLSFFILVLRPPCVEASEKSLDIESRKEQVSSKEHKKKKYRLPLLMGLGCLLSGSAGFATYHLSHMGAKGEQAPYKTDAFLNKLESNFNEPGIFAFETNADDFVEQRQLDGKVFKGSSDLELPYEANRGGSFSPPAGGFDQSVGLHFSNVLVPPKASILGAQIEFQADEAKRGNVQLKISGHRSPDAPNFQLTDIESRPETRSSEIWSPRNWNTIGELHSSSDIPDIIQEIVQIPGWASGNSVVLKVERAPGDRGLNTRVAENNPKLKISYQPEFIAGGGGDEDEPRILEPSYAQGLENTFYKGRWSKLPDFSTLVPDIEYDPNPSIIETVGIGDFQGMDQFALEQNGYLYIKDAGEYNFKLTSDDGSKLFINHEELIDNDGMHGAVSKYKKINLPAGLHPFRVEYFEAHSLESLSLEYSFNNQAFRPINRNMIYQPEFDRIISPIAYSCLNIAQLHVK
ncbi:MAG: hypothetical protein HRU09_21015, partial [Oligoflexales bacterium]|nr:hypothetical protein [Oligoflexales bacterium]